MRRDQLEHAIRTACQIIEHPAVVVIGSQAILGTFSEDQLPPEATMSVEVDILPVADTNDETARLADVIEGVAGGCTRTTGPHDEQIDRLEDEGSIMVEVRWGQTLVYAHLLAQDLPELSRGDPL